MIRIISIFTIIFISLSASSQEGLLIKNIKSGKEWICKKGSQVKYIRFEEDAYSSGILNEMFDSSVVLGIDTVQLKDIAGIRKKNPLHKIMRIAGLPFMLVGSIFMGQGAANMYSNPDLDSGIKLFLLGAGVFAVGYAPYYFELADLTVGFGGEWTLKIYREPLTK